MARSLPSAAAKASRTVPQRMLRAKITTQAATASQTSTRATARSRCFVPREGACALMHRIYSSPGRSGSGLASTPADDQCLEPTGTAFAPDCEAPPDDGLAAGAREGAGPAPFLCPGCERAIG